MRVRAEKRVQPALRFPVEVAPDRLRVRMPRWAQYSPDGSRVLFQALGYLWVKEVDGGRQRRLTAQSDHFELWPSFSRDGRRIVYTSWDDQELGAVRVVDAGGGEGRVVTAQPGHYVAPRFSPDGKTMFTVKKTRSPPAPKCGSKPWRDRRRASPPAAGTA